MKKTLIIVLILVALRVSAEEYTFDSYSETDDFTGVISDTVTCATGSTKLALLFVSYCVYSKEGFFDSMLTVGISGEWIFEGMLMLKRGDEIVYIIGDIETTEMEYSYAQRPIMSMMRIYPTEDELLSLLMIDSDTEARIPYSGFGEQFKVDFTLPQEFFEKIYEIIEVGAARFQGKKIE